MPSRMRPAAPARPAAGAGPRQSGAWISAPFVLSQPHGPPARVRGGRPGGSFADACRQTQRTFGRGQMRTRKATTRAFRSRRRRTPGLTRRRRSWRVAAGATGGADPGAPMPRAGEISRAPGSHHRAVRSRRRRRPHHAAGGREARHQARPALRGRERAGRRRDRGGARRACGAGGRLHHHAAHQRHGDQRSAVQEPAVRSAQGFRADLERRLFRLRVRHQCGIGLSRRWAIS